MSAEECGRCRFWLRRPSSSDCIVSGTGFGWCRNEPPKIIDHMARMAIRTPGFGGNIVDPEDVADAPDVHSATLYPATFSTEWCGRFEPAAIAAEPAASVVGEGR